MSCGQENVTVFECSYVRTKPVCR